MTTERPPIPSEVVEIARQLEDAGFETWCVGGALRDFFLGQGHDDVDLATQATPDQIQRLFKKTIPIGLKFGTVGVLDRRRELHEVTTFRRDVVTDGRHAVVEFGASLEEDLARRDFTINAMAYHPIREVWRDPFGGRADLDRKLIRAVGHAEDRFREDYLRILRAIRFATRLGFEHDATTWAAARAARDGLGRLSAERVRDEWFKSLETARSIGRLMTLWREVGAVERWLPELRPEYPFAADPPETRDPVLLTALLSSDPAATLARLKTSTDERDRGARIGRGPVEPAGDAPVEVRRWLALVGPAAPDLAVAALLRRGHPAPWVGVMEDVRRRKDPVSRAELAVTGDDLKAAGIPAGPELGRLLDQLLAAVIEDPSRNDKVRLLELARRPS